MVEQRGEPADIIELHANARGVDLIVMGGEPRRGWGRRSMVAERVIRRSRVPTLVVAGDGPGTSAAFRNVLVAVDLSPASKDVIRGALALTGDEPARLTVLHAAKGVEAADAARSPGRWLVPEFRTRVLEDARHSLETVMAAVPAAVDARLLVSTGSAARAILAHAADVNADLVVVGRSQGVKVLGPTALRVLRKNNRALLVTPVDARTSTGRAERLRAA
jgi:nucleotide-binding universal stress UspA family protein